jgi:hypothetical protein
MHLVYWELWEDFLDFFLDFSYQLGLVSLGTAAVAGGFSMSSSLQQQDPPVMGDILAHWPPKSRRSYAELHGAFTFPKASPMRISFSLTPFSLFLVIKVQAQRRIILSLLCTEYHTCIDCFLFLLYKLTTCSPFATSFQYSPCRPRRSKN